MKNDLGEYSFKEYINSSYNATTQSVPIQKLATNTSQF